MRAKTSPLPVEPAAPVVAATSAAPAGTSTPPSAVATEPARGPAARSLPTRGLKVASTGCASKLRVLADPTRLAVLESLIAGPKHVGAMQKQLGVEQSLLSHHLQTLREAGLVEGHRDGKAVLYRIAPGVVAGNGDGLDLGCCVLSFNE